MTVNHVGDLNDIIQSGFYGPQPSRLKNYYPIFLVHYLLYCSPKQHKINPRNPLLTMTDDINGNHNQRWKSNKGVDVIAERKSPDKIILLGFHPDFSKISRAFRSSRTKWSGNFCPFLCFFFPRLLSNHLRCQNTGSWNWVESIYLDSGQS